MKTKFLLPGLVLLIFFSFLIYSCSKREDPVNIPAETVVPTALLEAAKTWHALHTYNGNTNLSNNNNSNRVLPPDWKNAKLQKISNSSKFFIVVPSTPVPETVGSPSGMIRKIVFGTDGTNITGGVIIELFAPSDYIAKHRDELLENYNDNKATDFTGAVVFYDLNYKYIMSQVLKDGKTVNATAKVGYDLGQHLSNTQKGSGKFSTLGSCTNYYYVTTYTDGSETWLYLFTDCEAGGNSEVGGGGNSIGVPASAGSSPGGFSGSPGSGPGDHALTGHLLPGTTTSTQVANLCVFTTMGYISQFYGGGGDPGPFVLAYAQNYNVSVTDVISNGIPGANIFSATSLFFYSQQTTDVVGAINSGYPVMGTINNGGHEVFVTGYNNNGTYQYFDPYYGGYYALPPGAFTNIIKITGKK